MTPQQERIALFLFPVLVVLSFLFGTWKSASPLETIHIAPEHPTVTVGATLHLDATGERRNGKKLAELHVTWTAENARGQVDAEGLFTALEPGDAVVSAAADGVHGETTITVHEQPVATITVTDKPAQVRAGKQATFTVELQGVTGRKLAGITAQVQVLTAGTTVAAAHVVTDADGRAAVTLTAAPGVGENRVEIKADAQQTTVTVPGVAGAPATLAVTVGASEVIAGDSTTLQAQVQDQDGNPVPNAVVRFEVQSAGTEVAPSEAMTDAAGQAGTTVRTRPKAGRNQVAVHVAALAPQVVETVGKIGPPARLTIKADSVETLAGTAIAVTVTVRDAQGNAVAATPVQVALRSQETVSSPTTVVTHSAGAARTMIRLGTEPGDSVIEARVADLEMERLTVTGRAPTKLQVEPSSAILALGSKQTLRAVASDAQGQSLAVTPEWQTSGAIGQVTPQGEFVATAVGSDTIVATYGDVMAKVQVAVVTGRAVALHVSPSAPTIMSGATQQFQAMAVNAHAAQFEVSPSWEVTHNAIGEIDVSGLFTAKQAGSGEVIATFQEQPARVAITVVPGALTMLTLQPEQVRLQAGESVQFQASGYDVVGNPLELEPDWRLTADLGELTPTGLLQARRVGAGQVRVRAGSPPVVAEVPIEVVPGVLQRLAVQPETLELVVGGTATLRVAGMDAYGNAVDVSPAWRVTDGVGTVTLQGQFTAQQAGSGRIIVAAGGQEAVVTVQVQQAVQQVPPAVEQVPPAVEAAALRVPEPPASLVVGRQHQFQAHGFDMIGKRVPVQPMWGVQGSIGTITAAGLFTATQAGQGSVQATMGTLVATTEVRVRPGETSAVALGEVDALVVTPEAANLVIGESMTLYSEAFDAAGNRIPGRPIWSLTDDLGTLSDDGVFTARQVGTTTLTAVFGQAKATVTIRITASP